MEVAVSKRMSVPRDRVWAAMSDFANAPGRVTGIVRIEMLTPGPVGQATRFKETRIMFKREATETMEVIEWNPPSHYTLQANSCGCLYTSKISIRPDGNGSIVEMSFDAAPQTFMAKVMGVLMGWMMKGTCRKMIAKDIDDIERHLTTGGAGAAAAAQPA